MPTEPQNSRWRHAAHEAGHATATYLCQGTVEVIRLGQDSCCEVILPGREDPEQKAAIHALIDLAGLAAETLLCGAPPPGRPQPDLERFAMHVKSSFAWGWGLPTAKAVFFQLAETLLRENERTLWHLARALEGKTHVFGEECMLALAEGKRWFGIRLSPLLQPDWRAFLTRELADQRAMEKLAIREGARMKRLEEDQRRLEVSNREALAQIVARTSDGNKEKRWIKKW